MKPFSSQKIYALCFSLCLLSLLLVGCPVGLSGKVSFIKTIKETAISTLLRFDKRLYVATEDGKLFTYDISNPAEPVEKSQVDAFAGKHQGMLLYSSNQNLLLLGEDGKIATFSLGNPDKPSPSWGRGVTLQLPEKNLSHFTLRNSIDALYFSPGGGTAIFRLDLSALFQSSPDKIDLTAATKKFSGGGGAGIFMAFDSNNTVVKLYVGNKDKGTLDIYNISDIEQGKQDTQPISKTLSLGTSIQNIIPFREEANGVDEWLLLVGNKATENMEILFLGRHWKDAADPSQVALFSIDKVNTVDIAGKQFVTSDLKVYRYSTEGVSNVVEAMKKNTLYAEFEQREVLDIRKIVLFNGYIFTAEKLGLRVYQVGEVAK